ncbi:putative transcriptional coactivator Hfi1/Transcriptional adapter 1 [Plasmopara halstedii]
MCHTSTNFDMAELPALSEARKLKLQLFHRLQRTNCNAWERYWGSFRLYLVAKLSHKEFHAVAEELLGPNKHLHNEFVVALLSTACHENENENKKKNNLQPHLAQQIEKHSEEGNLAAKRDDTSMILDDVSLLDFKCAKQERSESVGDFEQQRISYNKVGRKRSYSTTASYNKVGRKRSYSTTASYNKVGRKRSNSTTASTDSNAEEAAVEKLVRFSQTRSLDFHNEPDHKSVKLLLELGKYAAKNEESVRATGALSHQTTDAT